MALDYRQSPEGSRATQKREESRNAIGGQRREIVSGSLLQDVNSPNFDNIIYQPIVRGGVESILALNPLLGYPRFRMDYEAGIFYLGKQRFSRAHWAYPFLPHWMQIQGRLAKETFSIFNNALWETLSEGDEKFHVRQICEECFGPLRMNADGDYSAAPKD